MDKTSMVLLQLKKRLHMVIPSIYFVTVIKLIKKKALYYYEILK